MTLLEIEGDNTMQYDPREALDRLDNDTALMTMLIAVFIKECPGYISRLQAACEHQDLQGLGEAAHTVKGSAAAIGFEAARKLAEDLEVACRQSGVKSIASFENNTSRLIETLQTCEAPLKLWVNNIQ